MQIVAGQSGSCDVLLIEPEEETRSTITRLMGDGVRIRVESDAGSGEEALRQQEFRLLVCADELPDLPGLMLMAKTQDLWPTMQRILMCRDLDGDFLLHALKSGGVLHYLPKPIDPDAAGRLIAHCLDQNRLLTTLLRTKSDLDRAETKLATIPLPDASDEGAPAGAYGKLIFWSALAVLLAAALLLLIFTGFYLIKSSLGIDFFPDNHLEDLMPS